MAAAGVETNFGFDLEGSVLLLGIASSDISALLPQNTQQITAYSDGLI